MGVCEGKRGFPLARSTLPGPASFLQLYTSALWYAEFSWVQCCRQQVGVSPNNPVQVSAGAQCPMSSTPPPTRVSER